MMKRMTRALACLLAMLMALPFNAVYAVETITYFHNDALGSPMVATDASGNLLWKESYQPYGGKLNNQPASANNKIGYAGKPFDNTTGLSYMGARYYDPVLGRFTGIDPVGYRVDNLQSFGRYVYANNNPYRFIDPDGNSPALAIEVMVVAAPRILMPAFTYSLMGGGLFLGRSLNPNYVLFGAMVAVTLSPGLTSLVLSESAEDTDKESPHVNPSDVAGKSPKEIDQTAKDAGLIPKGSDPMDGKGSYIDPVTGKQRVLVHGDHAHVNDAAGNRLDINGNVVPPNSPEAHLPIK